VKDCVSDEKSTSDWDAVAVIGVDTVVGAMAASAHLLDECEAVK
jgi:hypothetical protein